MLKARGARPAAAPPTEIAERRLWHDERRHTPCLGCWVCPERQVCGTLAVAAGITSCLDLCCGSPGSCDKPCRNHPDYALRLREVGGFDLATVPGAPVLAAPPLPASVSVIFHGDSRAELIGPAPVALPLYRMFRRRTGELRFRTHDELCEEFGLVPGTPIVLTGTDQDPPLERWWGLQSRRREIVRALPALGVVMSTTPNFSLFGDVPRHVDCMRSSGSGSCTRSSWKAACRARCTSMAAPIRTSGTGANMYASAPRSLTSPTSSRPAPRAQRAATTTLGI